MQHEPSALERHQVRLTMLWERLARTLGVHTVNVLLDRAIYQAAPHYPDLALIQHTDHGLSFDALAERPLPAVEEAFGALYEEMLLILARLLGQDMAKRLLDELQTTGTRDEPPTTKGG